MREIFHTEDCGLSLLCRCCRGEVCEQRLANSDRMRAHKELWPLPCRDASIGKNSRRIADAIKQVVKSMIRGLHIRLSHSAKV